jgi:hypothetical protein
MANSDTSLDGNINYMNSKGENLLEDKTNDKKPVSTDTDYYFNMIANPSKVVNKEKNDTESSELHDLLKDSETSKSSTSSRRSSTSSDSSKSSKSKSNAKYERLPLPSAIPQPPPKIPSFVPTPLPSVINNNKEEIVPEEPKPLTAQEIKMKKIELLRKLCEIKAKGFQLTKEYDFSSSLEEMEYEYELLRSFADKRNGVKVFRNGLLQAVSVIEFLNDKYDPFDFHLSGWGDHVAVEIDSWEDVLEELYEKYKGSGKKMAPEIKLLYLIVASAGAFHFTKSQAAKMPGLDSLLAANPGLLSKIINPKKDNESQFMTPQEINLKNQKEEMNRKDNEARMKQQQMAAQMQKMQQQIQRQQELLNKQNSNDTVNDILSSRTFSNEPMAANAKPAPLPATINANQLKPQSFDIRAPDQVKDILSRLHNIQGSSIKQSNTETQDETSSQNDRLVSETNLSENRKRQPAKKKKSNISIF